MDVLLGSSTPSLILFGGRGAETRVQHVPRTFRLEEVNATLRFATYDNQRVYSCGSDECDDTVLTGTHFNDVWAYDLGGACSAPLDRARATDRPLA